MAQAFTLLILLLSLIGCQNDGARPLESADSNLLSANKPRLLFTPTEVHTVELPSDALPLWRVNATPKPPLILLSGDPFLQPIPAALQADARRLAATGSVQQLQNRGRYYRSEPLLVPAQTLSAAIDAGLFSSIYWCFPSQAGVESLDLQRFREQMRDSETFSEQEIMAIRLENGAFVGTLRGLPFSAHHPDALPKLSEAAVVHFDLTYFLGLYKDEVSTPIYDLLAATLRRLQKIEFQPLIITISRSTLEGNLSTDFRFLAGPLSAVLQNPALLETELPEAWKLRAEALYQATFFQGEKVLKLYQQATALEPDNPAWAFDLFRAHRAVKQQALALAALDRAVALDPGYAVAYLELARDDKSPSGLKQLKKAVAALPDNPFILLEMADIHLQLGQKEQALALIDELRALSWSAIYHQDIPELLLSMESTAQSLLGDKERRPTASDSETDQVAENATAGSAGEKPKPPAPPFRETFEEQPRIAIFPRIGPYQPEEHSDDLPYWNTYMKHLVKKTGVFARPDKQGKAFHLRSIKPLDSVGFFMPLAVEPATSYRVSFRLNGQLPAGGSTGVGIAEFSHFLWHAEQYRRSQAEPYLTGTSEGLRLSGQFHDQEQSFTFTTGPDTHMVHLNFFREGTFDDSTLLIDDISMARIE